MVLTMSKKCGVILVLLLLALLPLTASAQTREMVSAQGDSLEVPRWMIDDRFYAKGLPLNFADMKSMVMIKYGEDGRLTKVIMDSAFVVPKEWETYEIPRQRVKNLVEIEEKIATIQKMIDYTRPNECADTLEGKTLPGTFALHDLDGNLWTEQSLKGHKVVINAWFSGCNPCLREMPILSEWKSQFPDVIFLSVNFEKADRVRKITEDLGFNWTHLYGDDYFVKFVGTGGFPLFMVLGKDGLVHYKVNGTSESIRQDILEVIRGL